MDSTPKLYPKTKRQGTILLSVKFVYAHKQAKTYTSPSLRKEIPELKHLYGFNAYMLKQRLHKKLSYGKGITIRISNVYQVRITPKSFQSKTQKIALQAQFFYRKKGKMTVYAVTDLKIKNGKQVAFVGPPHLSGRALIILRAKQQD